LTINAQGQITSASSGPGGGTVQSITAGTGLTLVNNTNDNETITVSDTLEVASTGVLAGDYINPALTVNAQGQITAASNGTPVQQNPHGVATILTTSPSKIWTVPSNVTAFKVTMVGAGGKGGDALGDNPPTDFCAPGGAGGSTTVNLFTNVPSGSLLTFEFVTSAYDSFAEGGVKMLASFNPEKTYFCPSGPNGWTALTNSEPTQWGGTAGYMPTTGDINMCGGSGGSSSQCTPTNDDVIIICSGAGGDSSLGGGAPGVFTFASDKENKGGNGLGAAGYGAGGSGATAPSDGKQSKDTNFSGGAGGPAVVIIEY
jgi:hypothetical protein